MIKFIEFEYHRFHWSFRLQRSSRGVLRCFDYVHFGLWQLRSVAVFSNNEAFW